MWQQFHHYHHHHQQQQHDRISCPMYFFNRNEPSPKSSLPIKESRCEQTKVVEQFHHRENREASEQTNLSTKLTAESNQWRNLWEKIKSPILQCCRKTEPDWFAGPEISLCSMGLGGTPDNDYIAHCDDIYIMMKCLSVCLSVCHEKWSLPPGSLL